jgi:hypothetical protein
MIGHAQRTYEEVAALMNLPAWMVSRIEQIALAKIRSDKKLQRLFKDVEKETQHGNHEYSYPKSV